MIIHPNIARGTLDPEIDLITRTRFGNNIGSKGTGDFEWCRQTMDELCVFGTSRTSNELKSGP